MSKAYTAEEFGRVSNAQMNGGFDKESGKTYLKYDDKTYELTRKQASRYNTDTNKIADEYMARLLGGATVEDVIEVSATLYAADMTDEQYSEIMEKLNDAVSKAKSPESKANKMAARQEFVDGKKKKKVDVTGNYNELPDNIKQIVINKVNSTAATEAQEQMRDGVERDSKLVYTEPYHGREQTEAAMYQSEADYQTPGPKLGRRCGGSCTRQSGRV